MIKKFLYGVTGPDQMYRCVRYLPVEVIDPSVEYLKTCASWMRFNYPSIEHVYMMDNSFEVYSQYRRTIRLNTMEANVLFKLTLEDEGIRII